MPLEDIVANVRRARIKGGMCLTPQDIARVLSGFQALFEETIVNLTTELVNIINTGGGGATTPVYILRARVNQVGNVPATQATFPFDEATDIFTFNSLPSGVTSGVAQNIQLRGFQDNEFVNLTSFNGTTWFADKLASSSISARVNHPGDVLTTDTEFLFDNATLITGTLPPGGTGTVVNSAPYPPHAYADNELIVLNYIESGANSGKWFVVVDDDDLGGGTGLPVDLDAGLGIDSDKLENDSIVAIVDTEFNDGTTQVLGQIGGDVQWLRTLLCNPAP